MSDRTYAKVQAQQKTMSGSSPKSSLLQRTCACGQHSITDAQCSTCRSEQSTLLRSQRAFAPPSAPDAVPGNAPAHDFSQIPLYPVRTATLQTKLTINQPGDAYEQEADQVAEQVMRMPEPAFSHAEKLHGQVMGEEEGEKTILQAKEVPGQSSQIPPQLQAQIDTLRSGGQPLAESTRAFMEPRFGYDFSKVRIHTDAQAAQTAQEVNARAYSVGRDIVFGTGQFTPETVGGRRLLAHELAHVIQQRSIGRPDSLIIQRQPKQEPTKQTPKSPPEKKKTLKEAGIGGDDPVFGKTAQIIDEVLQRNQRLAPYIRDRLESGFRIAEKGKFVQELSDGNFDDAYRKAYNLGSSETVPPHDLGFYDPKKSEVHLRPDARFGAALHEAVHKLATPTLYSVFLPAAMKVSENLVEVLKEGITAYFTDSILNDEGLTNFNDAYRNLKKKADKLVTALGFDLVAQFNFKGSGIVEIANKLGLSKKQYADLREGALKEVFKRMNDLL